MRRQLPSYGAPIRVAFLFFASSLSLSRGLYLTSKPSSLRQALCASISFAQFTSPFSTTQASLTFLVSAGNQEATTEARGVDEGRARTRGRAADADRTMTMMTPVFDDDLPGQAQHIFLPDLPSFGPGAGTPAGAAAAACELAVCGGKGITRSRCRMNC